MGVAKVRGLGFQKTKHLLQELWMKHFSQSMAFHPEGVGDVVGVGIWGEQAPATEALDKVFLPKCGFVTLQK